jgi:glycosyltransferase A (GT-A) superfamily protein (DUF2064 family)
MTVHVLVMAKAPVPGRVKTRLCPPCTPEEAAAVAEAALADTLEMVTRTSAARLVIALDGEPGPWLPAGFEVIAQRGDGLAARLGNAWADAGGAGIQIGMDTPHVGADELDACLAALDGPGRPAVLGPALDGGWWVIGLRGADPHSVFAGIPMSTAAAGRLQGERLGRLGFDVVRAATHRDIDTVADLLAVAESAPGTRTARVARRLELGLELSA